METVKKELEQEAVDWIINTSQHKSVKNGFIAGATSKYAEKQKLEFAIRELMWVNILIPFEHQYAKDCIDNKIKELEQQLSEL